MSLQEMVEKHIRNIPDFPKPGIQFKDITPLLANPEAFIHTIDWMAEQVPQKPDKIAAMESRGFIFAAALAYKLQVGFVPIRKPGKLPFETHSAKYELEYGFDVLEIHTDGVLNGEKVVIVDDVLATGGTASAAIDLIRKSGAEVEKLIFLMELTFLKGKEKLLSQNLSKNQVIALLKYE
ncbi:MAG: adenine phosphoribosyltransferase [Candidatus Hydrogenedentota bacterium]|nr:MAG: adenine phosphoribosyltransferase [Candidatus Hydrogenedentota bacterium]